jgi:hypothetical protein
MFCLSAFSNSDTTQAMKNKNVRTMPKTIQEVQEKYTDSMMSIPGVEGIGIGEKNKKECIIIFVSKTIKEMKKKLPKELDGFPVKIQNTGKIHALPEKK